MNEPNPNIKQQAGFSLIEMIIAMAITITITAVAASLLAQSMNIRTRANEKVDALADAQRALNIMSREIGDAGFNLDDNGIVAEDSVTDENLNSTIRIRSNLNRFNKDPDPWYSGSAVNSDAQKGISIAGADVGEDVKYVLYPADDTNLLARYDRYGGGKTVLANRLDSLHIHYFAGKVTYSTPSVSSPPPPPADCDITGASAGEVSPSAAKYLVIAVCVRQSAVGAPGSPGYQPESRVLLVSDVTLRNSNLLTY